MRGHPRYLIVLLLLSVAGCNWLTPLILVQDNKKKISPEFDKLPGNRVAVVVWTPPEVLFDYQYARVELAAFVSDKIEEELTAREFTVDMVDPRDIEDYLQRNPGQQIEPTRVGKEFNADYSIFIELLSFQIRDPERPQFLQGRIEASVRVYDLNAESGRQQMYDLNPVLTLYPETGQVVMSATNSLIVREQTYVKFAEQVARKFHEHTVEM